MVSQLDQLKAFTTVVADTGDFHELEQFSPQDATTNPSLILKAVQKPAYAPLLNQTVKKFPHQPLTVLVDQLLVAFGLKILDLIPGRVSTEVDARLSFDVTATVERAKHLISLYEAAGVSRDRVLIKIAATWEGIQAARQLEMQGIYCNLTLLFAFSQAQACGDAGVRLISPFVGRIYDWHKKNMGPNWSELAQSGEQDPGVQSVSRIYAYYKKHGIKTQVMGASFRNVAQVIALAGCDLLTISPPLLSQLQTTDATDNPVMRRLTPHAGASNAITKPIDEATFRFEMNEDAMATEKLSEGIRAFVADAIALDALIMAQH